MKTLIAQSDLYEAIASSRYVYSISPLWFMFGRGRSLKVRERFAIQLICKAYVLDGRYESAFGTDVTERVKRAFRAENIRTAGEIEWALPNQAS